MKKSTSIIFASALALATVFVGCKTEYTEDPDAVNIDGTRVDFTAQVISSDGASKSTAGLEGAEVSISAGGETMHATTDEHGNAHFTDLEEGDYAIEVSMAGHSTLNVLAYIESYSDDDGVASAQFTLFGGTSTITGILWANTDATNDTACDGTTPGANLNMNSCSPNVAASVTVTATLDSDQFDDWNSEGDGVSFSSLSYEGASTTATSDAAGTYTLTVAGAGSGLEYDVRFPDFVF